MCISHLHLGGVTLLSPPPFLSLSGQAASAREAEHLRAMLAAAERELERAAEREARRDRAEVDSRRQQGAPAAVRPSSPAQERARAAWLLGRIHTAPSSAERLVASPEERDPSTPSAIATAVADLDSISMPSLQRSLSPQRARARLTTRGATPHSAGRSPPHSPPPQEQVALSPASRRPAHAASSPMAIRRCSGVPPPSSHPQVLARVPDAAAAYAAFAAAAGGGASAHVVPGAGPKRLPHGERRVSLGHPARLVLGTCFTP